MSLKVSAILPASPTWSRGKRTEKSPTRIACSACSRLRMALVGSTRSSPDARLGPAAGLASIEPFGSSREERLVLRIDRLLKSYAGRIGDGHSGGGRKRGRSQRKDMQGTGAFRTEGAFSLAFLANPLIPDKSLK